MTTRAERDDARANLLRWLAPGDRVYTILRHRSASGMTRTIQLVKISDDGRPVYLGWNAAALLGDRYDRDREGVRVSGCGMDMGFHLVYSLASALWPEGFMCAGPDCPSNAHTNGAPHPHPFPAEYGAVAVDPAGPCPVYRCGRPASEHPTAPEWHRDGGYALRQEWV